MTLSYGKAIELMKEGRRVQRAGWNGKGMFVFLQRGRAILVNYVGADVSAPPNKILGNSVDLDGADIMIAGVRIDLFSVQSFHADYVPGVDYTEWERALAAENPITMPNFNMRAADGSIVTGWLASQTDMLAEDWIELK